MTDQPPLGAAPIPPSASTPVGDVVTQPKVHPSIDPALLDYVEPPAPFADTPVDIIGDQAVASLMAGGWTIRRTSTDDRTSLLESLLREASAYAEHTGSCSAKCRRCALLGRINEVLTGGAS